MRDRCPPAHRVIRNIFSKFDDIEEWRLGDPERAAAKGYPREYDAEPIDDYGIVFVDVIVEGRTGALVCHEVNGPNAVGSDALTGDSLARSENEAGQTMRRMREYGYLQSDGRLRTPVVAITAHQHWKAFRTGGEFYPRVLSMAETLQEMLPGNRIGLCNAGDELGDEALAIVFGDVPSVAARVQVDPNSHRFSYEGRPVVFAGNPNLLPELVRTCKLERRGAGFANADLRVFHAWRLVTTFLDKSLQQNLLRGTGIEPLRSVEAMTADDALAATKLMLADGAVVLKPHGCSGGAGIHVAVPGMSDNEIRGRIESVIGDCVAKYGPNSEATIFPIRCFPFMGSTLYPMSDGGHIWDLRIAVMFQPGRAFAYPVSMRLAPDPFDAESFHLQRDQWISNVSGRQVTLLKSGMDDEALNAVGLTEEKLEQALAASVKWTIKAWDRAVRDAGGVAVYEDACEEDDVSFYPWQKFSA